MKILLVKDADITIKLKKCVDLLNNISDTIEYEYYKENVNIKSSSNYIVFEEESNIIRNILPNHEDAHILYFTNRMYENNFFYYYNYVNKTMILSFYDWSYYTNLPIENGLFYFISVVVGFTMNNTIRHYETTGCIYDFLEDKTAVDIGMKNGYICIDCLNVIRDKIKKDLKLSKIYDDLIKILNILSNASKWNKNVITLAKDKSEISLNWSSFENDIANIYRSFGAEVKQNINLGGFQIDIYLEEVTPSRQKIKSIVECKFHERKIGNKVVNDFYRIVKTLQDSKLIDRGIIVSYSGFSQEAYLTSETTGIELLNYEDLEIHLKNVTDTKKYKKITEKKVEEVKVSKITTDKIDDKYPDIFTLMPFIEELEDVYYFGVLETAKKMNLSCKRVDEIEYVGGVLEKIYDSIKNAKIIVAEMTYKNSNVYYEVGYAHALNKLVIPITKDISEAPFDLKGFNHIIYKNIRDLQNKLLKRFEGIL